MQDTVGPLITLSGSATVTHEAGTAYSDEGASAEDAVDGAVTVTSNGSVTERIPGIYTLSYSATDAAWNMSTATRTIEVKDTIGPVITLLGEAEVELEVGSSYEDAGTIVMDIMDGDISASVEVSGEVNPLRFGEYQLIYSASDSAGNKAESVLRLVRVLDPFGEMTVYATNSALVIGQVSFNGDAAAEGDIVLIYVGDELRGKQEVNIDAKW